MIRRTALLVAAFLVAALLAGPTGTGAQAADPAPGTILAAQRLVRYDTRTGTHVLDARFQVQGCPGDTADGVLQAGNVDLSYYPHSKAVRNPCPDPTTSTCANVWDVTLADFEVGGPLSVPGEIVALLTVHSSSGQAVRIPLGSVTVQRLAPTRAEVRVGSAPAEMTSARQTGRCARVRSSAPGLLSGGCDWPPRPGAARPGRPTGECGSGCG